MTFAQFKKAIPGMFRRLSALCAVGSTACRGKDAVLDTETGLETCAGALIRSDRNRVCTSRKNTPVLHGVCCFR